MTQNKDQKLAVVTGGTRGIGRAISEELIAQGMKVVAVYHGNDEAAQAFKSETGAEIKKFDVCEFDAVQEAMSEIEASFSPIDVLVNNAGITRDSMMHNMSYEDWDDVLCTNLYSCFNLSRAVIPGMRKRQFGRIINISSINGEKGQVGQTNYSAAKAGVIGFTKALAQENASKNITLNAVCPGYIETSMTAKIPEKVLENIIADIPAGRLGQPEEIGAIVGFLASEKAGFITGASFDVNGGQYMD